jgi:hypothetical protein
MSQIELFFKRNYAENRALFGTPYATLFYDVCLDVVRSELRQAAIWLGEPAFVGVDGEADRHSERAEE